MDAPLKINLVSPPRGVASRVSALAGVGANCVEENTQSCCSLEFEPNSVFLDCPTTATPEFTRLLLALGDVA
ncbi:hypothetical protein EVAR_53281_1 [Eumeta japonica]|uniref:Uncharacterized protein n=1 Tax=Eumeta variegata TaxID=151549 RepID=A0A4C1YYU4_EUMVA|nr:hypothetical protein EVAR_53281_1 [Eumeta japonica]